jgi:DUF1680 family protein
MGFTGEARFGDWIETLFYNGIGASLPTEPDGRTFYYGDYRISGGIKQFYWHEWPCCSGTYWQTLADYHNVIYFRDAGGLYVNLLVPSEATWRQGGQEVRLRQETSYPDTDSSRLSLEMARPARFALSIRVPSWCEGFSVTVNDERVTVSAQPNMWATIERDWQPRDTVVVRVPMTLRMVPIDPQHPQRVAILYGPLVLAQDEACCRRPLALMHGEALASRLVREGPEPRFRMTNTEPERHLRYLQPLHTLPAFWPYWVYFDLAEPPLY